MLDIGWIESHSTCSLCVLYHILGSNQILNEALKFCAFMRLKDNIKESQRCKDDRSQGGEPYNLSYRLKLRVIGEGTWLMLWTVVRVFFASEWCRHRSIDERSMKDI